MLSIIDLFIILAGGALIIAASDDLRIPILNWTRRRIRRPQSLFLGKYDDIQSIYLDFRSEESSIRKIDGLVRCASFSGFTITRSETGTIIHRVLLRIESHEYAKMRNIVGVLIAEPKPDDDVNIEGLYDPFYYKIIVSDNAYDNIRSIFNIVEESNKNNDNEKMALDMAINLFPPYREPIFPSLSPFFESRGLPIRFVESVTGIEMDEWPKIHRD